MQEAPRATSCAPQLHVSVVLTTMRGLSFAKLFTDTVLQENEVHSRCPGSVRSCGHGAGQCFRSAFQHCKQCSGCLQGGFGETNFGSLLDIVPARLHTADTPHHVLLLMWRTAYVLSAVCFGFEALKLMKCAHNPDDLRDLYINAKHPIFCQRKDQSCVTIRRYS